jgi:fatty-acyl-CoA synthase
MTEDLLWPAYTSPADLAAIEAVPLSARGLPESSYALLLRAATRWPDRMAITVLPEAARWREPLRRTFAELLGDVHRYANLLHRLGAKRPDAVALISPNCAERLVPQQRPATGPVASSRAAVRRPGCQRADWALPPRDCRRG